MKKLLSIFCFLSGCLVLSWYIVLMDFLPSPYSIVLFCNLFLGLCFTGVYTHYSDNWKVVDIPVMLVVETLIVLIAILYVSVSKFWELLEE